MNPDSPEAGAPQKVLFAAFRERLQRTPFEPFRVVTTSGRAYDVPTANHAGVVPLLRLVHIADNRSGETTLHALHIASIEPLKKRKRAA